MNTQERDGRAEPTAGAGGSGTVSLTGGVETSRNPAGSGGMFDGCGALNGSGGMPLGICCGGAAVSGGAEARNGISSESSSAIADSIDA